MKKIIHYRNDCIGCGLCVELAPNNWFMNLSDGKATLRRSEEKNGVFIAEISEPEVATNLEAAQSCPVNIIKVIDENGQEIQ
ncbi:MAG: ferredoxin [bacterium]|nr:ferredoxin [bacterium]